MGMEAVLGNVHGKNSRNEGAGILLDRVHECIAIGARDGAQASRDEWTPTGSRHADDSRMTADIYTWPTTSMVDIYTLTSFLMAAILIELRIPPEARNEWHIDLSR
jgi:hypothetical protein